MKAIRKGDPNKSKFQIYELLEDFYVIWINYKFNLGIRSSLKLIIEAKKSETFANKGLKSSNDSRF